MNLPDPIHSKATLNTSLKTSENNLLSMLFKLTSSSEPMIQRFQQQLSPNPKKPNKIQRYTRKSCGLNHAFFIGQTEQIL